MTIKKEHIIGVSFTLISLLICIYAVIAAPKHGLEINAFGIDVSKWNNDVQYKNHDLDFVIIRLGFSSSRDGETLNLDEQFYNNLQQCIDHKIPYGIYYYSVADSIEDATREANYVLDVLDGIKPPLGIFMDVEDETYQYQLSKEVLCTVVNAFIDVIKDSNNIAGIYANTYWWNTKLDYTLFEDCIYWVANYNIGFQPPEHFHIFQYTEDGELDGENSLFDFNIIKYRYW